MSEQHPCRVGEFPDQEAAEVERVVREQETGRPWEVYLCGDSHFHVQQSRANRQPRDDFDIGVVIVRVLLLSGLVGAALAQNVAWAIVGAALLIAHTIDVARCGR